MWFRVKQQYLVYFSQIYRLCKRKLSAINCHILTIVNILCFGIANSAANTLARAPTHLHFNVTIYRQKLRSKITFENMKGVNIRTYCKNSENIELQWIFRWLRQETAKRKIRDELKEMEAAAIAAVDANAVAVLSQKYVLSLVIFTSPLAFFLWPLFCAL